MNLESSINIRLNYKSLCYNNGEKRSGCNLSPGLLKMWISLGSIVFMFISVFSIYFSRYKIRNRIGKIVLAFIAYSLMIVAGLIMVIVVFSGPTDA